MTMRFLKLTLDAVRRPWLVLVLEWWESELFGFMETTSNSWPRAVKARIGMRVHTNVARICPFDDGDRRNVGVSASSTGCRLGRCAYRRRRRRARRTLRAAPPLAGCCAAPLLP